jgi:signal transduction histidine kinase
MTLRLVALMSAVLLLTLAALGLLVSHYQERLMEEVQATASDVGRTALRTLEWTGDPGRFAHSRRRAPAPQDDAAAEAGDSPGPPDVFVARIEAGVAASRVRHVITTSTEDETFTVTERLVYPDGAFPSVLPGEGLEEGFRACLEERLGPAAATRQRFLVNVEKVRAETDPLGGLVLKIPNQPAVEGTATAGAEEAGEAGMRVDSAASLPHVAVSLQDEIRLPIRGNYPELFARLRNRSLFLFVGVFLVGMVLSTAVASRFTRPIRKLDVAIRRLSEGDLDVAVDERGKGEIGRLARAFNETARKLRANRDREREMVRREKLSALGRLAAGVAHDVRNPLHSIGLTLQHLSETSRPASGGERQEFDRALDVIRGEIRRLDRLVGNFLQFARSERREREPVNLAELLEDTERLVQKEAERRGVRIRLDIPPSPPPVRADEEAIRSAVLNLVLNALEAMPDGGTLGLALSRSPGEVTLEVSDTGQGIPEEDRERVFEFAYSTRDGGNGLGLAMVHHTVVEEHGGHIALDSRPGEGTRVRLTLPADGEGAA